MKPEQPHAEAPDKARRAAANIRLAVLLALVAVAIYAGFIVAYVR